MTVAVIDTGIDLNHPAFTGKLVAGYDFVDDDNDPSEVGTFYTNPVYGHGTHVAGIVAQTAPGAKIMPIRILNTEGVGELWRVTQAIIWAAENGADVVNISFGYPTNPDLLKDLIDACDDGVTIDGKTFAGLQDIVVVSGAGNGGNDVPIYPAGNRLDAQVGVAASNRLDKLWVNSTISNRTDRDVRAIAPGENIVSSIPNGRYAVWSGTSMAAPIVSGVAALMRQKEPGLSPLIIKDRLEETGIEWDCLHAGRGYEIKAKRVDAVCALNNNQVCGTNPNACSGS